VDASAIVALLEPEESDGGEAILVRKVMFICPRRATAILLIFACLPVDKSGAESDTSAEPRPPVAAVRPYSVPSPNGSRVDRYYWLRDDTRSNKEMLEYLAAENAYTDTMLAATKPLQEKIYAEIVARIKQDDATVPFKKRDYSYYRRYDTGKEYPIYARRRIGAAGANGVSAPEEVMLDVNEMAKGHDFFQVGDWAVSPDTRLLAWTEDAIGRRQYVLRVKNLATGEVYRDAVSAIESRVAWAADNKTLLYVAKDPVTLLGDKVRKHKLGTEAAQDALVYEQEDKAFYTSVSTTKDEQYLTIYSRSTVSSELRIARSDDPALRFTTLLPRERDHEYQAEHLGDRWILRTNWQAKNFRIVEVDAKDVGNRSKWRDLISRRADAFVDGFDVFRNFLAVKEHSNGLANIRIRPWNTSESTVIASDEPAYTTALGDNHELDTKLVRYTYTSLTTPRSTFDYDTTSKVKTLLKRDPVLGGFDEALYLTEHVWVPARDGTRVPVSLVYRKGLTKNGTAPLLQYGYGSYGFSMDPKFSYTVISLLDRGFVYAIAHIRGGQEMGRDWYENGKLLHKRNTFTDFIDVTQHLVAEKYADPRRVFAMGESAGGLLMGAIANIAPRDYRGMIALVPFVDAVTTMLDESIPLTTNEFDEWGNPKQKEYYEYMLSYSPYDNVTRQNYPAIFVGTGLWDSQVQYYEPAKWVAKLRATKADANPLLFRVNMEAGHGGKSGRFQGYRETAEQFAFLLQQAGLRD
jgi:oligopeptidase B